MSGDVQPRKRKDKRRKKEGTSLGLIQEPVASHKFRRSESDDLKSFDFPDQGEKIHVQNEHGIGGNICVKIIFFCLFGLLIGAVALIYLKSQGSTDVDLPTIEESRFAEYFTGWLDDSADDHEHEAHESNVDHDDHEGHDDHDDHEDHEDHEGHNDHDDHEDDNDEEDDHEHEEELSIEQDLIYKLFGLQDDKDNKVEEENVKAEEVPVSESAISHHDADEDENEENEEDNTEEEDDEEEEEKTDENDEDENNKEEYAEENDKEEETEDEDSNSGVDLEERNNDDNAEDDDDDDDEEEDKDENEDEADLSQMDEDEEDKYISSHAEKTFKKDDEESEEDGKLNKEGTDDDDDDDDDADDDDDDAADDDVEEDEKDNKGREDFKAFANNDDLGFEEIYISEEDLGAEDEYKLKDDDENNLSEEKTKKLAAAEFMEKLKEKQVESTPKEEEVEKEGGEEDLEEASGGVVVKLSVGIALIIVAHLVLVKKWKSMNNVPSDESVPTVREIISKKQEIENLHSSVEPVISRRQTLVPENVSLNDDLEEEEIEDEEEDEEDEEEHVEDEEGYSEEECEAEFVKSKTDNWELFEKTAWSTQKQKNIEKEYEEPLDNEEIEDEEEYEEEMEEVEDEGDEEEEECEEDDVEDENFKQKSLPTVSDKSEEEVKETAPTPIPPPRTRHGRGEQDAVEEDDDDVSYFEEINAVDESNQDGVTEGEINNNSGPGEQKTQEKKVENQDEWAFRQELNFADEQFANNPKAAVDAYDRIISNKPTMLRALVGRAKALDHWAEKEKSNAHLKKAINAYKTLLLEQGHLLDDETYVKLAERCIERMRFAGNFISSIEIHKALILKYLDTPKYRNSLAVTYLMMNKIPQARVILKETLSMWPENGFALVHYGFILKTSDNDMEEGAEKLMAGIQTREEGVIQGMFFFHLGDALNRLGREKEAMKWYELGVKEGLFLSKYQRSLYNVDRLKGQPWWTKEETTYQQFFKKLEENWREIRKEGLELLNSKGVDLFKEEAENLKDTGDWKQLDLYFRGKKQANCNKAPITCSLVSSFKPASTCTRGQIKFSVMLPNTHVWPHCGPTNCRLRSHLGLVVPKNTFIRVAEETRSWEEGKFIIFDDSFEHEVWHNGTGLRLVLIVDVWHPELSNQERRTLSPI